MDSHDGCTERTQCLAPMWYVHTLPANILQPTSGCQRPQSARACDSVQGQGRRRSSQSSLIRSLSFQALHFAEAQSSPYFWVIAFLTYQPIVTGPTLTDLAQTNSAKGRFSFQGSLRTTSNGKSTQKMPTKQTDKETNYVMPWGRYLASGKSSTAQQR